MRRLSNFLFNLVVEATLANIRLNLTGSRFFGTDNEGSDWDFYVQDSPRVQHFLRGHGFTQEKRSRYWDQQTVAVYKHLTYPIHIQLVRCEAVKTAVQNVIYANSLYRGKQKWQMAALWKNLLRLAGSCAYKDPLMIQ